MHRSRSYRQLLIPVWVATWLMATAVGTSAAHVVHSANPEVTDSRRRVLGLEGAANFRDIGGYLTQDGRHVRWARVFRSNQLSALTPSDVSKVDELKLAAVVDLRTLEERQRSPSIWSHRPPDIYESPRADLASEMRSILQGARDPSGARPAVESFYSEMPDKYRTEYAEIFHRIAAGKLPILIHCTAGKDRTGVAIALLLSAVRVDRQTIVNDYALTEKLVPPATMTGNHHAPLDAAVLDTFSQLPKQSQIALWRSDPDYILAALNSIDCEYGSIDGYMKRGLGVSDAEMRAIRESLIE